MFDMFLIAKAEYQMRNAKFNKMNEVEGVTVHVPNIIDRAVLVMQALLAHRTSRTPQPFTTLRQGRAVAK
jgi:hypothetical protein